MDVNLARRVHLFLERLELNPEIAKNAYWHFPVVDDGHSGFVQAGRGAVSSDFCGRFKSYRMCHDKEHHIGVVLNGDDFTGKTAVMVEHYWCHRAVCPVCFIRGYAVREAKNIERRLAAATEKGCGNVEHVVFSVPHALRDLPLAVLYKMCQAVARDRGVTGGCLIFHGRRINREQNVLSWSPHFHCLGFIANDFDVCRQCDHTKEDCRECTGFKGSEIRGYKKDGWLVKVEPRRKSVVGTAWYVLHHIMVKVGLHRSHSVHWFGYCGYRNLKSPKPDKAVITCPVCKVVGHHSEMSVEAYWGREHLAKNIGNRDYRSVFAVADCDCNGRPNFPSSVGGDRIG